MWLSWDCTAGGSHDVPCHPYPCRYEQEIQSSIDKGTIKDDLKWLLPCFAEDVARVIEREVRPVLLT